MKRIGNRLRRLGLLSFAFCFSLAGLRAQTAYGDIPDGHGCKNTYLETIQIDNYDFSGGNGALNSSTQEVFHWHSGLTMNFENSLVKENYTCSGEQISLQSGGRTGNKDGKYVSLYVRNFSWDGYDYNYDSTYVTGASGVSGGTGTTYPKTFNSGSGLVPIGLVTIGEIFCPVETGTKTVIVSEVHGWLGGEQTYPAVIPMYTAQTNSLRIRGGKNFSERPDSIIFWAKFPTTNNGTRGDMTCYLYQSGADEFEDLGSNGINGIDDNVSGRSQIVASAHIKIPKNNNWVRFSIPFDYDKYGKSGDAYPDKILLSFTAGENINNVKNEDQLDIDDILLVYNTQKLSIVESKLGLGAAGMQTTIHYSLSGVMDPFNNQTNRVHAYVKSQDGAIYHVGDTQMAHATSLLGNGNLNIKMPDAVDGLGHKFWLETTNYRMVSDTIDYEVYDEKIMRLYAVAIGIDAESSSRYGGVSFTNSDFSNFKNKTFQAGSVAPFVAKANEHCQFMGWRQKDSLDYISTQNPYVLFVETAVDIEAVFDTLYELSLDGAADGVADVWFEKDGVRLAGATYQVPQHALDRVVSFGFTLKEGYQLNDLHFSDAETLPSSGLTEGAYGEANAARTYRYKLTVNRGGSIQPLLDSVMHTITLRVSPDPDMGTIAGEGFTATGVLGTYTGNFKHFKPIQAKFTPTGGTLNPTGWFRLTSSGSVIVPTPKTDSLYVVCDGDAEFQIICTEVKNSVTVQTNSSSEEIRGTVKIFDGSEEKASPYEASTYMPGNIKVLATPAAYYVFQKWDVRVSNAASPTTAYPDEKWYDAEHTITNNTGLSLSYQAKAIFDTVSYTFVVNAVNAGGSAAQALCGSVSGAKASYKHGNTVSLQANPGSNAKFLGWRSGETQETWGEIISSTSEYSFEITGNTTLWAVFDTLYTLSLDTTGIAGIQTAYIDAGGSEKPLSYTLPSTQASAYNVTFGFVKGYEVVKMLLDGNDVTSQYSGTPGTSGDLSTYTLLFEINRSGVLRPVLDSIRYTYEIGVSPYATSNVKGTVSMKNYAEVAGTTDDHYTRYKYKHFTEVRAEALPSTYCSFSHWYGTNEYDTIKDDGGQKFGSVLTMAAGENRALSGSRYTAVFVEDTNYIYLDIKGPDGVAKADLGKIFLNGAEGDKFAYSAFNTYSLNVSVEAKTGFSFTRYEVREVDIKANPHTESSLTWNSTPHAVKTNEHLNRTYYITAVFDTAQYDINQVVVTSQPAVTTGGYIEGQHRGKHALPYTLIAYPNTNFTFVEWQKGVNRQTVSTKDTLVVIPTSDTTLYAVFDTLYTLNFNVPVDGLVENSAKITDHNPGEPKTITARAGINKRAYFSFSIKEGYMVKSLSCNGIDLTTAAYNFSHTDNNYTFDFEMNQGGDVNLVLDSISYTFNLVIKPAELLDNLSVEGFTETSRADGQVTYTGNFKHFTGFTAIVTPKEYCSFVDWTRPTSETFTSSATINGNQLTVNNILASDGGTYIATLVEDSVTVSLKIKELDGQIAGTVKLNDNETLQDASTKTYRFSSFRPTTLHLKAQANTGYSFTKWSIKMGSIEGTATETDYTPISNFNLTENVDIVASFDSLSCVMRVNWLSDAIAGTPLYPGISVSGWSDMEEKTFCYGNTVKLIAQLKNHYHFAYWRDKDEIVLGTEPELDVWVCRPDSSITAVAEIDKYHLDVKSSNENLGSVSWNEMQGSKTDTVYNGWIYLNAAAKEDCEFRYWVIEGDTVNEPGIGAVIPGGGTPGMSGIGGGNPEDVLVTTAQYSLHLIDNESYLDYPLKHGDTVSVLAIFSKARRRVQAAVEPFGYGIVRINDSLNDYRIFEDGTDVTLKAEPSEDGYEFVAWVGANSRDTLSRNSTYTIPAIGKDTSLVAIFRRMLYEIRVDNPDVERGIVYIGENKDCRDTSVYYREDIVLRAEAEIGYVFSAWVLQGKEDSICSTENPYINDSVCQDIQWRGLFVDQRVNVNLTANPREGGMLSGAGRHIAVDGDSVQIAAIANTGYEFITWVGSTGPITQSSFKYPLREGDNIYPDYYGVAYFKELSDSLVLTAYPENSAFLTGAGRYKQGYNVRVNAIPAETYEFVCWTSGNDTLSFAADFLYTFQYNGGNYRTLTAHMKPISLQVNFIAEPENAGSIRGERAEYGKPATATAEPAYGYVFSRWEKVEGDTIGFDNPLTYTVYNDTTFKAVFVRDSFDVTVILTPEDGGTVVGNRRVAYLDTVDLNAVVDNSVFDGWYTLNGRCYSREALHFQKRIYGPDTIEARFSGIPRSVPVRIEPESYAGYAVMNGKRVGEEIKLSAGDEVELTPGSLNGYDFQKWVMETEHRKDTIYETANRFVYADSIRGITLIFDTGYVYITSSVEPANTGRVWMEGGEETPEGYRIAVGALIRIHAEPYEGYVFKHFNRDTVEEIFFDTLYEMTVSVGRHITAIMDTASYELTVISTHPDGMVFGSGLFKRGQTAYLQAWSMNDTIGFDKWCRDEAGEDLIEDIDRIWYQTGKFGPDTVYAFFTRYSLTLTLMVNNADWGSATASNGSAEGTYVAGQRALLEASPRYGYDFVCWNNERGGVLSRENPYELQITSNREITAVFEPIPVELTLMATATDGGELNDVELDGAGVYRYGDKVYIQMLVEPFGYGFEGWYTKAGVQITDATLHALDLYADDTIYAKFSPQFYRVSTVISGYGSTHGEGSYRKGATARLTATAAENWMFVAWKMDGKLCGTEDTLELIVYKDLKVEAVFAYDDRQAAPKVNIAKGGGAYVLASQRGETTVTVMAVPKSGYEFLYWELDGEVISREAECRVTLENSTRAMAHFKRIIYTVELSASLPEGIASLTGAGSFHFGNKAKLGVVMKEGYEFKGWYCNGAAVSTKTETEITVTEDMRIEARVGMGENK